MYRALCLVLLVAALLAGTPARADDVSGADKLVCAAMTVVICMDDGECAEGDPVELNVPQFIEMDFKQKTMNTTEASGEGRSTPITSLERGVDEIVLQVYEVDRAASFVIAEKTGRLSVAVAAQEFTISVFGACTPLASSR